MREQPIKFKKPGRNSSGHKYAAYFLAISGMCYTPVANRTRTKYLGDNLMKKYRSHAALRGVVFLTAVLLYCLVFVAAQGGHAMPSEVYRKFNSPLATSYIGPDIVPGRFPELTKPQERNVGQASGSRVDQTFNTAITDGTGLVFDSKVQADGKTVIGGLFERVGGVRMPGIARLNPDGSRDVTFNVGTGANERIFAIAIQPDGKIIAAGSFTRFNGQSVSRIVRLNSDGSIDTSFTPGVLFNNAVHALAIQADGKILVGGVFSAASRLVRLNTDGSLDAALGSINVAVLAVLITHDNKILVGGGFSPSQPALRKLNLDGSADSTYTTGTVDGGQIFRLVQQTDGKIIAGGSFSSFTGIHADGLARLNANGTLFRAYDFIAGPTASFELWGLGVQTDGMVVAAYSYYVNELGWQSKVIRLNTDSTIDAGFLQGDIGGYPPTHVSVLANGKILVGGMFTVYNGQLRLRLVRLNPDGSIDAAFDPAVSSKASVRVVKYLSDGKVLVGGNFQVVNGIFAPGLARLNRDGSVDTSFNFAGPYIGAVMAVEVMPDGRMLVGGDGDVLLRINADGSRDTTFSISGVSVWVAPVTCIALQSSGKIVLGGGVYDDVVGNAYLARYNADGSVDDSFSRVQRQNGAVWSCISRPGDTVVASGTFIGGTPFRNGIAGFNSNGTINDAFSAGAGSVYALDTQPDGKIVAGGTKLSRFTADGLLDPTLDSGTGLNLPLRSLAIQPDGKIVIGGDFTTYNGTSINRIARVNPDGSLDQLFNIGVGPDAIVYAVDVFGDEITIAGDFTEVDGVERLGIARLKQNIAPATRAPFDFDGDGKTDIGVYRPNGSFGGEWWYLRSSDGGGRAFGFGASSESISPADFTGDGKTDIAVFRPSTGIL